MAGSTPVLVHNNDLFGCSTGIGDSGSPGERVPPYSGEKANGIYVDKNGEQSLTSGYSGPSADMPKGTPGMNGNIKSHVEAHAAALMRNGNIKEAALYINRVPCPGSRGCAAMLPRMLPEDATLHIYGPGGYYNLFTGLSD